MKIIYYRTTARGSIARHYLREFRHGIVNAIRIVRLCERGLCFGAVWSAFSVGKASAHRGFIESFLLSFDGWLQVFLRLSTGHRRWSGNHSQSMIKVSFLLLLPSWSQICGARNRPERTGFHRRDAFCEFLLCRLVHSFFWKWRKGLYSYCRTRSPSSRFARIAASAYPTNVQLIFVSIMRWMIGFSFFSTIASSSLSWNSFRLIPISCCEINLLLCIEALDLGEAWKMRKIYPKKHSPPSLFLILVIWDQNLSDMKASGFVLIDGLSLPCPFLHGASFFP